MLDAVKKNENREAQVQAGSRSLTARVFRYRPRAGGQVLAAAAPGLFYFREGKYLDLPCLAQSISVAAGFTVKTSNPPKSPFSKGDFKTPL